MSDGGRERASLGVEVCKSFQKSGVQRSTVRSIAWLGVGVAWSCRNHTPADVNEVRTAKLIFCVERVIGIQ